MLRHFGVCLLAVGLLVGWAPAAAAAPGAIPAVAAPSAETPLDLLAKVSDARKISTPVGTVVLPPAGSWQVGPVDLTPTKHVVFLWLTGVLLLLVLLPAARIAARQTASTAPRGGYNLIEATVLYLRDRVVLPQIPHEGQRYVPFVLTMFFFILFANLIGLIPFGAAVTANISVTAGLALLAFLVIEYAGIRTLGWRGYLSTIFPRPPGMGTVGGWLLAILLAPVELLGKLARPFALAVRLMANILGGKLVIYAILGLIFVFGSYVFAPIPVMMVVGLTLLKLFVAFLQAYIFVLLTSVFIGLITEH